MNCPNPKCKKTALDVSRTFGSPDKVERDRKCFKCGAYYRTVERFVYDIDQERAKFQADFDSRVSDISNLQNKFSEIKSAFEVFMSLLDVKKKR